MTKLKQPDSLETLSIRALVHFLCDLSEQLMPIIATIAKCEAHKFSDILENCIKTLRSYLEYNVPCFLYDHLCHELFIEVPKLIARLKKRISSMGEFLRKVNVAVSLTEVLISKNLKQLNFEIMPKMIRHVYYNKLSNLTGLETLNLGSLSGGWKTTDMEPTVLGGIIKMPNLQNFCLNYDCTDNILLALVSHCPRLHSLDVSSSKSITNDSMMILFRFNNLRNVHLYRTSVTGEGIINLLLRVPKLEDIGRYDEIGRCLEYIIDKYPNKQTFRLKKFSSRFVTTRFLQILAEHCPDVYYVSIFHNVLLCDLMMLAGINKLSDLRLLSCDFFADQIHDVLHVKGCNLTHLHLEHVDQIDMNALMYISQYCPDLKVLTFYNCEMIASTSMYIQKPIIPPFMNLERLTLIAQCELFHLEFLLSSCYHIRFVNIGTMVPSNDHSFGRILAKNPMVHLQELSIICSEGLTISTVYKLLEVCPNLTVLNELEQWVQIQATELEAFKIFVKTNNLDLDIESKRFMAEH